MLKKILSFIVLICTVLTLSSCGKGNGMDSIIKYGLDSDPKNLDPQVSDDEISLTLINNMYEGLMAYKNNNLVNGLATSYKISDDGLKYTFSLRKDAYWLGFEKYRENVTAHDFVFAFKRLVDKTTYSPYSEEYFDILNAEKIYKGELQSDQLGVKALDNYTLEINLQRRNSEFLNLLAQSSSMPCKKDFFYNSKGKYGLEEENIICNGAFYLTKWIYDPYGKDNYIILKRNADYNKYNKVYPYKINFFIKRTDGEVLSNFKKEKYDVYISDGSERGIFDDDFSLTSYQTKASGIVFNYNYPVLKNKNVRKALSMSINRKANVNKLAIGVSPSFGIIPLSIKIKDKGYRQVVKEPAKDLFNVEQAKSLWNSSLNEEEKNSIAGKSIIIPKSCAYSKNVISMIKQWQSSIEFNCIPEVLPDEEYLNRLENNNYFMAFVEIKADKDSASSILNRFSTSGDKGISIKNKEYDNILKNIGQTNDVMDNINVYSQAEKYLIDNSYYIPLFYREDYIVTSKDIDGVEYNPFSSQLDFKKAKKYE